MRRCRSCRVRSLYRVRRVRVTAFEAPRVVQLIGGPGDGTITDLSWEAPTDLPLIYNDAHNEAHLYQYDETTLADDIIAAVWSGAFNSEELDA